jgi:7-carboxy-7-deazaguanine synthase
MDPTGQFPEKVHSCSGENHSLLPVVEIFPTIQGEGFHTGKGAVFIRLAGCDICCNWCDSKESWDAGQWPGMDPEEIMLQTDRFAIRDVIVSGGEPLQHDLTHLTSLLKEKGFRTFLETSGAYPLTGEWYWICLSPKKNALPLPSIYELASELKMVIVTETDFARAEQCRSLVSGSCLLYLQPEWSVREKIIPEITAYILKNPDWMLSLQSHKYIGIP